MLYVSGFIIRKMYYERDITGNKEEFIIQKACEWIAINSENVDIKNIKYKRLNNRYCIIEFNHVYNNAYNHSQISDIQSNYTKYLLIAGMIHIKNGKIEPQNCILINVEKNKDIFINQCYFSNR
jgi:hypothetical protein